MKNYHYYNKPMNENPTLNFELTLAEANSVLAGLQELPAKVCNPLSQKITQQAKAQLQPMREEEAAAETFE